MIGAFHVSFWIAVTTTSIFFDEPSTSRCLPNPLRPLTRRNVFLPVSLYMYIYLYIYIYIYISVPFYELYANPLPARPSVDNPVTQTLRIRGNAEGEWGFLYRSTLGSLMSGLTETMEVR